MNKTIYIRPKEERTWTRARELAGRQLSKVIMKGLERYVAKMEAKVCNSCGHVGPR